MAGPTVRSGQRVLAAGATRGYPADRARLGAHPAARPAGWHQPQAAPRRPAPTATRRRPTPRACSGGCTSAGAICARSATANGNTSRRPTPELYDFRTDPAERSNVLGHKRNTAATLSKTLAQLAGPLGERRAIRSRRRVDSATAERLRPWATSPDESSSAPVRRRGSEDRRSPDTWPTSRSSPTASMPCRRGGRVKPSGCSNVWLDCSRQLRGSPVSGPHTRGPRRP